MRILFISNFYPPCHRGGYEEWCQEIAMRFVDAGHSIEVLTSTFEVDKASSDADYVYRQLNLEMEFASLSNGLKFFTHRKSRIQESLGQLRQRVAGFQPDAILVWGMWNLPFDIPALAEELLPGKVAYYLGDYWPTLPPQFRNYWEAAPGSWKTSIPKAILAAPAKIILKREVRPTLKLEHGLFCSSYLKDELQAKGIQFQHSHVLYGAIDTEPYRDLAKAEEGDQNRLGKIEILSVSRLIPDKGIKTIILALEKLVRQDQLKNVRLNIVGSGDSNYEAELRRIVSEKNLDDFVFFAGSVPKSAIPTLYQASDIFVFASVWPEPFGRVIVEAMASGVAVVATSVGGAAEILEDGANALTFSPEDEDELAYQLKQLVENSDLQSKLVAQAKKDACEKFDLARMFSEIEAHLGSIIN